MLYYVPNEFTVNYKHVSNSIITGPNISKCKSVLLEIYFIEIETEYLVRAKNIHKRPFFVVCQFWFKIIHTETWLILKLLWAKISDTPLCLKTKLWPLISDIQQKCLKSEPVSLDFRHILKKLSENQTVWKLNSFRVFEIHTSSDFRHSLYYEIWVT